MDGSVKLNYIKLKELRKNLGLSQEKLALSCQKKSLCLSIATLKRAECGRAVFYRTAAELARFYQIPVTDIIIDENSI